jgi:PIN domain nuclease of toxin-antitoxin system
VGGPEIARLLLDTHIWIWSAIDPDSLGNRVREHLEDNRNEIWLSPISAWEAMMLAERGRVRVATAASVWVEELLRITPAREAALTHDVAIRSCTLSLAHRDPADRFLAATAIVHDLTLVTADERLLGSREYDTLAN